MYIDTESAGPYNRSPKQTETVRRSGTLSATGGKFKTKRREGRRREREWDEHRGNSPSSFQTQSLLIRLFHGPCFQFVL